MAQERSDNEARTPFTGSDDMPVGDTDEHAGEQDEEGRTAGEPDAERGGTGGPTSGPHSTGHGPAQDPDEPAGRVKRDPVGGEGEGATAIEADAPRPKER